MSDEARAQEQRSRTFTPLPAEGAAPAEPDIDAQIEASLPPIAKPKARFARLPFVKGKRSSEQIQDRALFDRQTAEIEQLLPVRETTAGEKFSIGAAGAVGDIARAPELAAKFAERLGVPKGLIERHVPQIKKLADFGRGLQQAQQEAEDPRFADQGAGAQLLRGAGSMLPFAVAGPLGGSYAVAATGAAQTAVPMYEDVLRATDDEDKAWAAAAVGLGLGATEALGAGKAFARLNKATAGGFRKVLVHAATQGIEEAIQEWVQSGGQDIATRLLSGQEIGPKELRDISAAAGQSALIGALLGTGVTGAQEGLAHGAQAARAPRGPVEGAAPEPDRRAPERIEATISGLKEQPAPAVEQGGAVAPAAPPDAATAPAEPAAHEETARAILAGEDVPLEQFTREAIHKAVELRSAPSANGPAPGETGQPAATSEAAQEPAAAAKAEGATTYAHTDEPAANFNLPPKEMLQPTEELPISSLKLTQLERFRQGVDEERVDALVDEMGAGKPLPPITAMRAPNGELVVLDGHHRVEAAKAMGFKNVPVRLVGKPETNGAKAPAPPTMRTADVVASMRRLVQDFEVGEGDDLPGSIQTAESVLDQRRAAGIAPTELDAHLAELVKIGRLSEPTDIDSSQERAQTAYTEGALKKAHAMLDVFDAAKKSAQARRATDEKPANPSEAPKSSKGLHSEEAKAKRAARTKPAEAAAPTVEEETRGPDSNEPKATPAKVEIPAQEIGGKRVAATEDELPPEIIELGAFPGGLLDPVYRAAGQLMQRLRRTPPLQNGAAPIPTARWSQRAIQRYVDYFEPVSRIERAVAGESRPGQANLPDLEDAYLQETLRRGRTLHGPRGLNWLEETHQKPLLALIRGKRISLEEADAFLMARAAHDGNKLIRARNPDKALEYDERGDLVAMSESPTGEKNLTRYGMSDEEATEILDRVKADARAPHFDALGEKFDQLNRDVLAVHVASGRMTQEQVDALQKAQPHYAPARTDMSDETGKPIQLPSGKKRIGKPFQKALGRESRAEFPLAFAFAQAEQAIVQGEVNRTRKAFLDFARAYAEDLKDAIEVVTVPMRRVLVNGSVRETFDQSFRGRDDVVTVWEKGRPVAIQIDPRHADLAKALNQLGPNAIEGMTRLASAFNRMRSAFITRYRPFFWPKNMIRDAKSAAYLGSEFGLRFSANVVKDIPKALATLSGKETALTPYLKRYREAGAPIAFMGMSDFTTKLDKIKKGLASPKTTAGDKAIEGFLAIKDAMNAASDIGENGTRFSAFVHAIEDLGFTDARAASYAKEMQNFERKGLYGNAVSAWYLFANAGIQSTRRFGQAIRNPAVRRLLASSFVAAMGWDQLQRMLGGDDDDGVPFWDKIPDYEKQGNFVFMYPDGSGRRVTIPAPFMFGAINYTGEQLSATLSGNIGAGRFFSSTADAWINAVNPLGQISGEDGSGIVRALMPDMGRLPLEITTNRDWRGKPFRREPYDPHTPDSSTAWPDVNPHAKAAAEWLNRVSGGDLHEKGAVDVSPETLEHVAEFFASGLPQDLAAIVSAAEKALGGTLTVRDTPLLKSFLRDPSPFASWSEQKDLLYSLEAERKRAIDGKRLFSGKLMALIQEGKAVEKKREATERPKKGSIVKPLDELPDNERKEKLQQLDIEAQRFNKKAREALRALKP